MPKWVRTTVLIVFPAILACCAVALENSLRSWAKGRAAALPLIMLLIGTSLLNPRIRNQIFAVLSYGVAFLAIRDTLVVRDWRVPIPIDHDVAEAIILCTLLLVAVLSGVAAVAEALTPGTVWARRCYFAAASLYCSGLGVSYYGEHGTWQAIVLCVTGITAFFGCLFAPRLIASEEVEPAEDEISDETEQRRRDDGHVQAIRSKEWQDPATPLQDAGNVSRIS